MPKHNIFFFSIVFFILGILLVSLRSDFLTVAALTIFTAASLSVLSDSRNSFSSLIILTIFIPAGAFYYYHHNFTLVLEIEMLLVIKSKIIEAYQKLLTIQQAGLLSGVTLGEKGDLTKDFLNKLSLSGTRHLIALSGLHLTIVVMMITGVFKRIFSRKTGFFLTILVVFTFVLMTGFKLSAARAALMATIVAIAKNSERLYNSRNSIALAGLILILIDPKVLVFDIGFQLSFLAVLGIIYLLPTIQKLMNVKGKGFLNWKENFLITISAQLATAPILIIYFSNFTLTAFIANILILTVIPITMGLGFLMGILYYIFYPAAVILSWLVATLLNYEIFIVNLFSEINLSFNPILAWWGIILYYGFLILLIVFSKRIKNENKEKSYIFSSNNSPRF